MKENQKVIILNGLARGGTNITWNILQSHPNIVSPMREINQVLGKRGNKNLYFRFLQGLANLGLGSSYMRKVVSNEFIRLKPLNLEDQDNKYKSESTLYTKEEIDKATICLKGVCNPVLWDLQYTKLIHTSFASPYFIYLIRHGHALCESWIRRDITAKQAGYYYARFFDEMLEQAEQYKPSCIIRFEDLLNAPFDISRSLFEFAGEAPYKQQKLRLKSKKVIQQDDSYGISYGKLNSKYWFDEKDIYNFLMPDIGERHQNRLSSTDRKNFDRQANSALNYFNYDH